MFTKPQLDKKIVSNMTIPGGTFERAFNLILTDVRLCSSDVINESLRNLSFSLAKEISIYWEEALAALHKAVEEGRPVGEFLGTFAVAFPKLPPITEEEAEQIEGYGSI